MMTKPIYPPQPPRETVEIASHKRLLRRAMREKRAALNPAARAMASDAISQKVIELLTPLDSAMPVAIYLAKGDEVDVDKVARYLLHTRRHIVAPCHSAAQLTAQPGSGTHEGFAPLRFRAARERGESFDGDDDFSNDDFDVRPGVFGVREPVDGAEHMVPPSTIGAFVLPGLAFDTQGYRLGYGGGWFDKALAGCLENAARPPLLVGVCFDCQVVDSVPREAHDVRMNIIVTESRLIEIA